MTPQDHEQTARRSRVVEAFLLQEVLRLGAQEKQNAGKARLQRLGHGGAERKYSYPGGASNPGRRSADFRGIVRECCEGSSRVCHEHPNALNLLKSFKICENFTDKNSLRLECVVNMCVA